MADSQSNHDQAAKQHYRLKVKANLHSTSVAAASAPSVASWRLPHGMIPHREHLPALRRLGTAHPLVTHLESQQIILADLELAECFRIRDGQLDVPGRSCLRPGKVRMGWILVINGRKPGDP